MEWNPEVVRRVRGAMQDRARSQACLFKAFSSVMTREQAEALARLDVQVDVVDSQHPVLALAELLCKPPNLQKGGLVVWFHLRAHSPNSSFALTHRAMWPLWTTMGGVSFWQDGRRLWHRW